MAKHIQSKIGALYMKGSVAITLSLVTGVIAFTCISFAQERQLHNQSASGDQTYTKKISITLGEKTIKAVVADQEKTLLEGLLGYDSLTDDEGMLLDFGKPGQYAIHMQGMKFPIDALWIDARGVVKLIYEQIQPNSGRIYPSVYSCRY